MQDTQLQSNQGSSNRWIYFAGGLVVIILIGALVVGFMKKEKVKKDERGRGVDQMQQAPGSDAAQQQPAAQPTITYPAKLYLEPAQVSAKKGEEVAFKIMMDTLGKNTVAAQVTAVWDTEKFEYVKSEFTDSAYPMSVVNKPGQGRVEIARGVPGDRDIFDDDDGFTGTGEFATVVVKVKDSASGGAKVSFTEDSFIVLDDGKGTKMEMEYGEAGIEIKN